MSEEEERAIALLIDTIQSNFKPASDITSADVTITTQKLLKKIDAMMKLSEEAHAYFVTAFSDAGFKTGIITGDNDFNLYWMLKTKS